MNSWLQRTALRRNASRAASIIAIFTILLGSFNYASPMRPVQAQAAGEPTSVTIAGSLQSALGCSGDWDPACAATHLTYDAGDDVWQGAWNIPAGSYEYKAALNDNWTENYGLHAASGGANIPLNLASGTTVKFYYDHKSHWITDNVNSVIATVPGSFQSALGCPGDWDPGCLHSWLEDPDGDGIYTFETTSIPQGSYEAKVALNEGWDVNYGQGGVQNGANIPFTVPFNGAKVIFHYDSVSHVLTILAGHGHDNNVEWDGLRFDSRDTLYRTPVGAVPAGTPVKIRFRTFHNDVTDVRLRLYSISNSAQSILKMALAASNVSCYQAELATETCDFYQVTLPDTTPDTLWYRFIVTDGTKTVYYADNTAALDGGLGTPSDSMVDNSYALTVYDPAFTTPDWAKSAIIYQIFPDRFRNGNKKNDPQTGMARYNDPAIALPWGTLPEGYCRNYYGATDANCPWRFDTTQTGIEQPRGRDYFGGDLRGVIQELDYLQSLGVSVIYFNPIFTAKSNHRYDTADYTQVDPNLGSLQDFRTLVQAANGHGIRVVLDGVFNHMSSDSPFFDRYHHYDTLGACESAASSWRTWFTFRPPAPNEPAACVPSTSGGYDTYYNGWAGFDSIPVITKTNPEVQSYFLTAQDSITKLWLNRGIFGWRMDVMGDSSFPAGYWETFRQVVKSTNPDALIVGELWQKDSTLLSFLRGGKADTTMDYRFRDAVIGLLAPGAFDSKGFADSGHTLKPSEFAARVLSIREDNPDASYYTMMNLLDSHDTARLRWVLTPGQDNAADKEQNAANVAAGKLRVKLASLIQFTMPGSPTVYYGDEVGMTGADDPDDRRTYPWKDVGGTIDSDMLAHYTALGAMRNANPVLASGDLRMLVADDATGGIAYGRKTQSGASLVVLNVSDTARDITIPLAGYIPDGIQFTPLYGVGITGSAVSSANGSVQVSLPPMSGSVLATGAVDLTPPAAPTGLNVTHEGNGQVSLAWDAGSGAAGYNVYRSPLSGGGYVRVNSAPISGTTLTDTDLANAQLYYYVVKAVNAMGVESGASNEVSALPHLTIGWASTQWPYTINHIISAVTPTENVYGQVWIDGVTSLPGQTPTLQAQLGFGAAGTNPATDASWRWVDASFNVDAGNNDEFKATLLPDAVGTYDYLYRYTTTNGRDWLYADINGPIAAGALPPNPGKLTITASDDTTPPAVPANLRVTGASPSSVDLSWDAVPDDPTMYGYEILRSPGSGGPYTQIARVTGTSYSDTDVVENGVYYYVVRAVDQPFNRSGYSNEVRATAELRTVAVTFNVTVPASTDGTGRSVYIAGTLNLLDGNLPDWNPGSVGMTRVDATHWTITLTGKENINLQYKYALGDWSYVEKDASCGEISNRLLTLSYGSNGTQTVNDTVDNWRNISPCGN